jgi:serine/threonine protein kinase
MNEGYEAFCLVDPFFYDSPILNREQDSEFAIASRSPAPGWERSEFADWLVYKPQRIRLPKQGWKIHVSACLDNAEEILAVVWDYCTWREIAFKFIRSERLLFLRNAKSADRGSSGKFVTIYPADEAELETVLTELGVALDGRAGPYILSDLRWGAGPLYVRYGGFVHRRAPQFGGGLAPAIEGPDGEAVPDRRGPTFEIPTWVGLPECLRPQLAARNDMTVEELPYSIEKALHFSNAGGVYLATDRRIGEPVVLKEARPHAGLSADGADALARLRRERDILERLRGLDVAPALRGYHTAGGHEFLAQEFIEGSTLSSLLVQRYPLTSRDPDAASLAGYAAWVMQVCGRLETAVGAIHEHAITIGDFNPTNVMVGLDGRIVLVDWEAAALADDSHKPALGTPGFIAPPGTTGFDIDRYALACLRLYLFLPLTALIRFDRDKAEQLGAEIGKLFPTAQAFVADAVRTVATAETRSAFGGNEASNWSRSEPLSDPRTARDSMIEAIVASATPGRRDRLFPGDVKQFVPAGGINLAYGAAGVLYALNAAGARADPEHESWLIDSSMRTTVGTPLGLYDGLLGVAYVLDRLGRKREAVNVVDRCIAELGEEWHEYAPDLFGGLAGIGLALAYFAGEIGNTRLLDAAEAIAMVIARLGAEDVGAKVGAGGGLQAGIMHGWAGPALFFLRLHDLTGDTRLLDEAAVALRKDLRRCVRGADGALHVNEGWRTLPYFANGSVGIGMVIEEYLAKRDDEEFAQAALAIHGAAAAHFYNQSGLFHGRGGMILYLCRARPVEGGQIDVMAAAQLRRLNWHRLIHRGQIAFPGDQLLRLSMDLATGTAGVMLAVSAALNEGVNLPFFGPLRPFSRGDTNDVGFRTAADGTCPSEHYPR